MTSPTNSDIHLIQRAARGDAEAFEALFHEHFQAAYNYALWLCNDIHLAEDLTQEVFIKAHRNLHKFGPPWRLKPWLYRMIRNLFIDHIRRERRVAEPLDPQVPLRSPKSDPERQMISSEQVHSVREAIRRLPTHHREALVLRELNGFSYSDISNIMNVSLSHVKVLLHRARTKFKDLYGIRLLVEEPLPACQELRELLDTFHDQETLVEEEEQFVQAHLKECDKCQQRQRELTALAALLVTLPPFVPPPKLGQRILERTTQAKDIRQVFRRSPVRLLAAASLAAVALSFGWLLFSGWIGGIPADFTPTPSDLPLSQATDTPPVSPNSTLALQLALSPTFTLPSTIEAHFYSPTPSVTVSPSPPFTATASPTPSRTATLTQTVTRTPTPSPTPDIQGPNVSAVSDSPDPIFTGGSTSVTAMVSDPSSVASVSLYYNKDGGKYLSWGAMTPSGGDIYSTALGPLGTAGTYDYRIVAMDGLGNTNCSVSKLTSCPGGTVTVNLP